MKQSKAGSEAVPKVVCRARTALAASAFVGGAILLSACDRDVTADRALTGYIEADLLVVAPGSAGTLAQVAVARGDTVAAGQLLFRLETDAQALSLEAAEARRAQAQAQVLDLGKGRRDLEVRAAQDQLMQAQAALRASTSALERQRALVKGGYVSAATLDQLQAARDRDAALVAQLQAQRKLADQPTARDDQIAAARAAERGSAADLALAQWQQAQRSRTAPVAASVFDVMYQVGEFVPAGAPVVALLTSDRVKVRFFVPEPMLARVTVGSNVAVSCSGCASGLSAKVRWVSPQAEFTPPVIYGAGTRDKLVFMVEATPLDAAALKPGQPVDVRLVAAAAGAR